MTGRGLTRVRCVPTPLRNHRAIVAAAREAFEQVGPEVSLEEVARRAGVGPSTLYRRFAGRDELVAAVFEEYFEERVEPLLARAAGEVDPWAAVVRVLEEIARALLHRRGILRAAKDSGVFTAELAPRVIGPLSDLVARARAAGVLRADVETRDLPAAAVMAVATAAPFGGTCAPTAGTATSPSSWTPSPPTGHRGTLPPLDPPPHCEVAERLEAPSPRPGPDRRPSGSPTRPSDPTEH